jgi:hypothetical protein
MRSTTKDRRIMWGWVAGVGTVKGGNCAFACTRTGVGAYSITITEPGGLPVPCAVTLTTVASNVVQGTAEHSSFPAQRSIGVQTRAGGVLTDNDFYWTAVG